MLSQSKQTMAARILLPLGVFLVGFGVWYLLTHLRSHGQRVYPEYELPSPASVWASFLDEAHSGRLRDDVMATLFRVGVGFGLAVLVGVPFGLLLGLRESARMAFLPAINFYRNLSPLAWIPYAILWFQIGDKPAIFLIFLSCVFPLILATIAAVATIPAVHFRVAREYGFRGPALLAKVTLPAIMPQIITALRVVAGVSWVVVVAAEMVGCQNGLGYAIYEARNGEAMDTVTCYMIIIGLIGVGIDLILAQLTRLPSVRWGYDR